MGKDAGRDARDDVFVVDETEEEVAEVAVALRDKGEVAYARLAVGVEAVNRHAFCEGECGSGERGE